MVKWAEVADGFAVSATMLRREVDVWLIKIVEVDVLDVDFTLLVDVVILKIISVVDMLFA